MSNSLIKKLKGKAIDKVISKATGKVTDGLESLLSKVIGIKEVDLSTPRGLANFVSDLAKKLLGIDDDSFLVPGLKTPVLLSPTSNKIPHELSLKNTTTLIENLTSARKTFEQIPAEKINDEHRHKTLVHLNLLISHLENLRKIMENCKKKCPLKSNSNTQYTFRKSIITCLNLLIDFHSKIPDSLTEGQVQTKFYTAYVAEYETTLRNVRKMAAQTLRESAKTNLTAYYKSWGLGDDKAIQAAQFFSIDDATVIFNTLQTLKDQSNDSFFKKGKNTFLPTKINLNNETEISVKYQKAPLDPSTKLGNEPLKFDYKHWLEIYNNANDIEIKKIAEKEVKQLNLKPQPGTSQIKDIALKIGELAKFTVSKLDFPSENDLIKCLYQLLNYIRAGSNKETTLLDVQKPNTTFVTKIINRFNTMHQLKKQIQKKYPYLKIKDNKNADDSIKKMQELLNYDLDYPKGPTIVYKLSDGNGGTIEFPEITDNKINLKKFKDSLLGINTKIWGSDNDTDQNKISRLNELHLAMSLCLNLLKTWTTQVKNLSKQLDPAKVAEKNTGIQTTAKTYMHQHKQIISDNPKLKSIAKKIKVLQLSPFGSHSKKLLEYCKQLVAGVDFVLGTSEIQDNHTILTAPLKPKKDINERTKTDPKLKKYNEIRDYCSHTSILIKQSPSHYANMKKLLSNIPLNDSLWALAHLKKVDEIYTQFNIYRTNLENYSILYKTCEPNKQFLNDILELPLIQDDSKTKAKAQSLRKLNEKFLTNKYSGTPEDYIELTQKIDSLRKKLNEKFYDAMKSYKDEKYANEKAKMGQKQQDKMDSIMKTIGTTIKSDTDYLEIYKKFIGILTEKLPDLKDQLDNPKRKKKTGLRDIKSAISNKLHPSKNIKFLQADDNS